MSFFTGQANGNVTGVPAGGTSHDVPGEGRASPTPQGEAVDARSVVYLHERRNVIRLPPPAGTGIPLRQLSWRGLGEGGVGTHHRVVPVVAWPGAGGAMKTLERSLVGYLIAGPVGALVGWAWGGDDKDCPAPMIHERFPKTKRPPPTKPYVVLGMDGKPLCARHRRAGARGRGRT